MKLTFFAILTVLLISACQNQKNEVQEIDFSTNYKFSSEIDAWVEKDTTQWKYQISAADYATKGDYKNALLQWDLAMGGRDMNYSAAQIDSINSLYTKTPAKDYILERAKNEQVIIINEAHHSSFHRFFTKSLLQELYDMGYKNLGMEGLINGAEKDSLLNERMYPVQATGFYTSEPQFANLVREALKIGFHVFAYEQTSGVNNAEREIEQARNIEAMIKAKPGEKFLLHVGFDHAYEGTHGWWGKAMAARLNEYTGIDPFTINQTNYAERGNPEFNHPFTKAINTTESVVLLDAEGQPYQATSGEAYTDIAVIHPTTQYTENRPNWLFNEGTLKQEIDLTGFGSMFPVFVLAFKEGEDIHEAVPVDITEVKNENQKAHLALSRGHYQIVITNKERSFLFNKEVN